jgi:hypothetical protein
MSDHGRPKMRAVRVTASTALLAIVLATAGCTTYYRVTDPSSGKTFYTNDVRRSGSAVMFKDAKSDSEVTLQASEVKEITQDEFTKNTAK